MDLISPTNTYEFNMEKGTIKNFMEIQTAKVTGHPEIVNKKYIFSCFQGLEKKRKREMDVVDFVIIRGQQSFERHNQLNSSEIKIEENRIIIFLKNLKITHINLKQWGFYFQVV